jgi:hypothetical protein
MSATTIEELIAHFQQHGAGHVLISDGVSKWAVTDDVTSDVELSEERPTNIYFDAFVTTDEWCETIGEALTRFKDGRGD